MRLPDFHNFPDLLHGTFHSLLKCTWHIIFRWENCTPTQTPWFGGGGVGVGDVKSLFSFWWSVCEGTSRKPMKSRDSGHPLKVMNLLSIVGCIENFLVYPSPMIPVLWFQWKVNVMDKQIQVPMLKLNKILIWLVGLGYTQPMNASWDAIGILNSFFHPIFLLLPSLGYWIRCSALPQHFKELMIQQILSWQVGVCGWWLVVDGLPSHRNPLWFRDSYVLKRRVEIIVNHHARSTNQPLLEVMWHEVPAYNQTCWERKKRSK